MLRATFHMIFGFALLLAMIGDSPGQSQEPSPSSREAGNPPQEQPQSSQQNSAVELRGTPWMTIFSGAVAIGAFLQAAALAVIIRTTKRQSRAYIGVSLKRPPDLDVGHIPRAIINYKNFGQTPASDVRYWANMTIEPHPSSPQFEFQPLHQERVTINPADVENIIVWLRIYLYGDFWYFDIFGKEWHTEFRLMYGGQHMIDTRAMTRCAKANSAT